MRPATRHGAQRTELLQQCAGKLLVETTLIFSCIPFSPHVHPWAHVPPLPQVYQECQLRGKSWGTRAASSAVTSIRAHPAGRGEVEVSCERPPTFPRSRPPIDPAHWLELFCFVANACTSSQIGSVPLGAVVRTLSTGTQNRTMINLPHMITNWDLLPVQLAEKLAKPKYSQGGLEIWGLSWHLNFTSPSSKTHALTTSDNGTMATPAQQNPGMWFAGSLPQHLRIENGNQIRMRDAKKCLAYLGI